MHNFLKHFLYQLLCCCFICFNAFGDGKPIESETVFEYMQNYKDFIDYESQLIDDYMVSNIKPKFSTLFEEIMHSDVDKIILYRDLMAKILFAEYKSFFMWRLEQKSKETGREIKHKELGGDGDLLREEMYWLDAGIMDSEECNGGTYQAKNRNRRQIKKQLRDQRLHTCLYPDGFEEYSVYFQTGTDGLHMIVHEDNKSDSAHFVWSVTLSSAIENNENIHKHNQVFDVYEQIYDYSEYYREQNEWAQDVKDGMFEPLPRKEHGCKKLNGKQPCHLVDIKDSSKWQSLSGDWGPSVTVTGGNLTETLQNSFY